MVGIGSIIVLLGSGWGWFSEPPPSEPAGDLVPGSTVVASPGRSEVPRETGLKGTWRAVPAAGFVGESTLVIDSDDRLDGTLTNHASSGNSNSCHFRITEQRRSGKTVSVLRTPIMQTASCGGDARESVWTLGDGTLANDLGGGAPRIYRRSSD